MRALKIPFLRRNQQEEEEVEEVIVEACGWRCTVIALESSFANVQFGLNGNDVII